MRLLLISNSTSHGGGYLDHCAAAIDDFLGEVPDVLFVPWALADLDGYTAKARERFAALGRSVVGIHEGDPVAAVENAQAVFIGGGNTFRLLDRLYANGVVEPLRRRIRDGTPYIGTSAGTNVATLSIRTTNDMPIVMPPSFEALALVPFNINPHYLDPDLASKHQGETREERIREFHEENDPVVVGLREGAMLRVEGSTMELQGTGLLGRPGARIFERNADPYEVSPGARLDSLLTDDRNAQIDPL